MAFDLWQLAADMKASCAVDLLDLLNPSFWVLQHSSAGIVTNDTTKCWMFLFSVCIWLWIKTQTDAKFFGQCVLYHIHSWNYKILT